jgi:glycosyltransferase involved in cell wall biosynthesis
LRLLVITHYFWPEEFRINDLVRELVARGHDVTVLTCLPNYPQGKVYPEFKRDPGRFANYAGAKVVRVPMIPRGQNRFQLLLNYFSAAVSSSLMGAWKLRKQRFDAIFVFESSPVTVGIPALILRASKKAPVAFWVLDLWPQTLEALGVVRSGLLLKLIGGVVSFIYRRCDLILAQSRSFIPEIARYASTRSRIEYFPGWAEAVFASSSTEPRRVVAQKEQHFDIMFAGNIGEAQDFPTVLAAADLLKSDSKIRWLIVGDGRMADWVKREIQRRALQHCVLMLGRFPIEDMPSLYRGADALLVSLKDEPIFAMTIPGKVQTYLAVGMPIVAMLNGEGADIVTRSQSGVTANAGDARGLAEAVLRLASLAPTQVAQMRANALAFSASEFDRDKLITRLERWLEELSRANTSGIMKAYQ